MIRKLPKGWEIRTLGEVTDIFKGRTPKRNVEKYFQGNIAWATPTDITKLNGVLYIDDTETHISEEALGKSSARLLPAGTVLSTFLQYFRIQQLSMPATIQRGARYLMQRGMGHWL